MVSLMDMHTSSERADWELVKPTDRNKWQKIAFSSKGLLTASNVLSILGLVLVILGLIEIANSNYISGALLIAVGRLFDILDGFVAELTKTKSPLGEIIDTTVDKICVFTALIAIAILGVLPFLVIAGMVFINLWISLTAIISRHRQIDMHPSLTGKLATATIWISLVLFLFAKAFEEQAVLLTVLSYILFAVFLALGSLSATNYSKAAFKEEPKISPTIKEFTNFVVILNPNSSNARRTLSRVNILRKLLPEKLTTIRTTKDRKKLYAEIQHCIDDKARKTLLFAGGGDGTLHDVINAVMASKHPDNAAVLPIWGGNANDFAYMLNGASYRRKLTQVLKKGRIVQVKPLKISIKNKNNTFVRYAACYASFGASAFAAHQLDSRLPIKRNWLLSTPAALTIQEIWSVTDAFKKAPEFSAEINGEKITIFEEAFMNGSRIAKINTIPLKLTDNAYYHAHQPNKHPLLSRRVIQALTGRKFGNITSKPTKLTFNEPVIGQFDGEVERIEKGSEVTVSLSTQAIHTISLKL
jgi:cardiolipin synthase (CMP-forming)